MASNISEEDVHQAIGQVMHPEINRTLVELGMVKDIALKNDEELIDRIEVRDTVVYAKFAGDEVGFDHKRDSIISRDDILAVIR